MPVTLEIDTGNYNMDVALADFVTHSIEKFKARADKQRKKKGTSVTDPGQRASNIPLGILTEHLKSERDELDKEISNPKHYTNVLDECIDESNMCFLIHWFFDEDKPVPRGD